VSVALDSSITVAWYFADERTAAVDAVLSQVTESGAVVPPLWRLEVANALQMSVKRNRIDPVYRDISLDALRAVTMYTTWSPSPAPSRGRLGAWPAKAVHNWNLCIMAKSRHPSARIRCLKAVVEPISKRFVEGANA
jgi:hypothetical protein